MTGKKSFFMLSTILLISFALMVFIAGTEPHTSQVSTNTIGEDPSQSSADLLNEQKHLTAAIAVTSNEYRMIQQLTRAFHEQKHDLRIHIQNVNDDMYEWIMSTVRLGEAPDIMLLENEWVYEMAAAGMLLPVDEVFKREEHAEHFSQVMAQLRWNGYTWAVPKEVDPYVLVWNTKMIEDLGMDAPESRDQMVAVLDRYQMEDRIGIFTDVKDFYAVVSLYSLLQEGEENTKIERELLGQEVSFEQEEEEAMENNRWSHLVERWMEEWEQLNENPWQAMKEERIIMMIAPFSEYGKQADDSLQFIPLQALNSSEEEDNSYIGLLKGKSFAISASTSYKKEALEWITYMTTGDAQLQMLQAGSSIPVRSHTSQLDALLHFPFHGKLWDAIELGVTFPAHPRLPKLVRDFHQLKDFEQLEKDTIDEFLNTINQWTAEVGR